MPAIWNANEVWNGKGEQERNAAKRQAKSIVILTLWHRGFRLLSLLYYQTN